MQTFPGRVRRTLAPFIVLVGVIAGLIAPTSAGAAPPVVSGGLPVAYTEQAAPVVIGGGVTVNDGGSYGDGYVELAVRGAETSETLSLLRSDAAVVSDGVVSIVGDTVYLGNGTTADPIGTVDPDADGTNGSPLRVLFVSPFANPGFETGDVTDWTPITRRIDLGADSIAGFVTNDTSSYAGDVTNQDNNVPENMGTYTVGATTSGEPTEGTYALRLESTGIRTAVGCDVVHGPGVYSSEFEAGAGDLITFDWRAFAGGDAYHVFGYIIDRDGNQTEVLDTYTTDDTGSTAWTTKETIIPTSGWYRFVFVSGTYDATCGRVAGASLLIDNVRVFGSKANDGVVEQIAGLVSYENSSDDPADTRTIDITMSNMLDEVGTGTVTVEIDPVDDAPTMAAPAPATFVNTIAEETFTPVTGTLSASDPDDTTFTYGIDGAVEDEVTIDGTTYTHRSDGTYASLHVDAATGRYAVVADAEAVNGRTEGDIETFTVTVNASTLGDEQPLTVVVDVPASVPGPPAGVATEPGDGTVALTWDLPWWHGGSDAVGYVIESSEDGTTWESVVADTGSDERAYTVTGLTNGDEVAFRVSAINATGTGAPSESVASTPRTVAGAPTITSISAANRTLTVRFVAPDDDGGAEVTGYRYSTDNGRTWTDTGVMPGTDLKIFGLTNATTYPVRVRAVNVAGAGAASTAVAATPVQEVVTTPSGNRSGDDSGSPADGTLVVNGERTAADVSSEPGGSWSLSSEGLTVSLTGVTGTGDAMRLDAQGRLIAHDDGFVRVTGSGFAPGSLVDVWVMSTPRLLGTVTVGPDGTFSADLPLPSDLETGDHTVQLNGLGADGRNRTVSAPLIVMEAPVESPTLVGVLPVTGSSLRLLVLGGALSTLVGGALLTTRRRMLAR